MVTTMALVWTVNSMLSWGCNYIMQLNLPAEYVLQCKRQFARSGQIPEFHIFAPPNAASCTVPPGADTPFPFPPPLPTSSWPFDQLASKVQYAWVIAPKSTEFGKITQIRLLRRSWSFKVTIFGTSVCDFLCTNNSNLHHIFHHFQDMADYWQNFRCRQVVGLPLLNGLVRGKP